MVHARWSGTLALVAVVVIGAGCSRSSEPATDAEKLERGKALVLAGTQKIAASKGFSFSVAEVVEREGKPRASTTSEVTLRRPDRLHIRTTGDRDREFWYDGRRATVAMHGDKIFAQAEMPDTLDRTLDAIIERYDMPIPLADALYSDPGQALFSENTKGGWVGVEDVAGTRAVHLQFHEGPVTWDLWVPETGDPLPLRARVAHPERKGKPTFDMTFSKWNLGREKDADAFFDPKVPMDYEGVAMIQREAIAKAAAKTEGK